MSGKQKINNSYNHLESMLKLNIPLRSASEVLYAKRKDIDYHNEPNMVYIEEKMDNDSFQQTIDDWLAVWQAHKTVSMCKNSKEYQIRHNLDFKYKALKSPSLPEVLETVQKLFDQKSPYPCGYKIERTYTYEDNSPDEKTFLCNWMLFYKRQLVMTLVMRYQCIELIEAFETLSLDENTCFNRDGEWAMVHANPIRSIYYEFNIEEMIQFFGCNRLINFSCK